MERMKLNYEPLRAAVKRGDRSEIEVMARRLRDEHIADLVVRAAAATRSAIDAARRRFVSLARLKAA